MSTDLHKPHAPLPPTARPGIAADGTTHTLALRLAKDAIELDRAQPPR